jgi:hypothetical protein
MASFSGVRIHLRAAADDEVAVADIPYLFIRRS